MFHILNVLVNTIIVVYFNNVYCIYIRTRQRIFQLNFILSTIFV